MKMVLILYLLGIVAVSANAQIIKENLKRQLLRHLNTQGSSTSTGRQLYPLTDVPGEAIQGFAYGAGDEDALVMMREG